MELFEELLDDLLMRDVSFYICRLPESTTLEFGAQLFTRENLKYDKFTEIEDEGFVLSPFAYPHYYKGNRFKHSFFIKSELCVVTDMSDAEAILSSVRTITDHFADICRHGNEMKSDFVATDKESYINRCENFINEARNGVVKKAILSRPIFEKGLTIQKGGSLFFNLLKQNPTAMVSLVYIPGEVCWVTASPEQLIRVEDGFIHTISLAGTREAIEGSDKSIASWSQKDIAEQQLVSEYIEKKFRDAGIINYKKGETITKQAGLMEHICTAYSIAMDGDDDIVYRLISEINPTPAVCGDPIDDAFNLICGTESYDRGFYAGYLGRINKDKKIDLYVNLRCASLMNDGGYVYVGGGITADSDPESEWLETELKAKTILKALIDE